MTEHRCPACGQAVLVLFADLGEIPVLCGVHFADADAAASSPVGRMAMAYCPSCAYVRNVAFDPAVLVYDTTMDTNLHHSPAFQSFSAELVEHLGDRYRLRGARRAGILPPPPGGLVTVQRRVSCRGGIMVATQKIQVGMIHAGQIVTVVAGDGQFRLVIDGETAAVVPRTTTREIHRYKAYTTRKP